MQAFFTAAPDASLGREDWAPDDLGRRLQAPCLDAKLATREEPNLAAYAHQGVVPFCSTNCPDTAF